MKDFKVVYLIKKVGTEQYLCSTEWKGEKFIVIKPEVFERELLRAIISDCDLDGDILVTFNSEDSLKNSLVDFNILGHECEVVKIDLKYTMDIKHESYYI